MSIAQPSLLLRLFLLMMVAVPASAFLVLLRVATEGGVPSLASCSGSASPVQR